MTLDEYMATDFHLFYASYSIENYEFGIITIKVETKPIVIEDWRL